MSHRTAAIIGGGIGGLTTALCLAKRGWTVQVLEQAQTFGDVGAGIQMSPNAANVLEAIDPALFSEVLAAGVLPEKLELRDGLTGARAMRLDLPDTKARPWAKRYFCVYRPALVEILARWAQADDNITVEFDQHVTVDSLESLKRNHDLLVIANGLHSQIVQQHFYADPPQPSGHIAYRAVVPMDRIINPESLPSSTCGHLGPDRHAVTYDVQIAGNLAVNFVGIAEAKADEISTVETDWDTHDARDKAMELFGKFKGGIPNILAGADIVRPWALHHRAPLPAWHNRNAVLLGDAAHPMLPTFAQGAAMAMEDAWVLARELDDGHTLNNALARYTGIRLPRVTAVYEQSMRNLHLFHQKGWFNQTFGRVPPMIASAIAPQLILRRFDAVYNLDVTKEG